MSRVKENIFKFFNRIFRRNKTPMITDISSQNYAEYRKTYDTLSKMSNVLDSIDAYLIGGICAAILTNQDLYRQNSDLDIMCKEEDLPKLIQKLQEIGYSIDDRRNIKTRNLVNSYGIFQAVDHELNADTRNKNMLGIGIFTYQVKGNKVITHSYAFEEKEGKFVGTENVLPKELFDLMYDSRIIDYKNLKLKVQSKEYLYMIKNKNSREKDKLDASTLKPILDDKSESKIARIKELEAKTRSYRIVYDKDGKIESRTKYPTLEEKVYFYLDSLFMNRPDKTPEQIIADVLHSDEYYRIAENHPEINSLIEHWKEKSSNYTYQDKIKLLTASYSKKLEVFSKSAIDNALDFLHQRYLHHGKSDNDIELSSEAKEIFGLMQEYGQAIKKIFVDNNISITHITSVAPDKLEGGVLRKSLDRANNYETERANGVFASSSPVNGSNPYIARNSSGMILLGDSTYIFGSDNITVAQDSEGKKHAILKQPNYIYYINPETFTPVCNLTVNPNTHKPIFEFSEEWISDTEIDISNPHQVKNIDKVDDVTSLLENYTILCDVNSQGIGIEARQKSRENAIKFITEKINDGSIRNINQEAGINNKFLSDINR